MWGAIALLVCLLGVANAQQGPKREVDDLNRHLVRLYEEGKVLDAIDAARKNVELAKSKLGAGDPSYADSLNNLAALYKSAGRYLDAEPLAKRALKITRRIVGNEHPDYADCLNNLAVLYKAMGRYEDAKPLYEKALETWRKIAGGRHPSYAVLLNNLAGLHFSLGEYAQAEPLYEKALEIKRKRFGTRHPSYATTLNNLADLYRATGRYDEAEPLYGEALGIRKEAFGSDHPDYAMSLNSLAVLYSAMGRYADADPLYRKASKIYAEVLGKDHPGLAGILSNRALLYDAIGREDRAEPLYKRALEIREKTLGKVHPDCVTSLLHLAAFHHGRGQYSDARRLYEQALLIKKNAGPANDPAYAAILYSLALLEGAAGHTRKAFEAALGAFEAESDGLSRTLPVPARGHRVRFLRTLWPMHRLIQTLALRLPNDPLARSTGLQVLLRMKAAPLDELIWEQRCLAQDSDPKIAPRLKRLSQIYGRLAFLALTCPEKMAVDAYYSEIKKLKDRQAALEAELLLLNDEFRITQRARRVSIKDVQARMPRDTVLLAYACTPLFDFDRQQPLPPHYLVYVLHRDSATPGLVDMGEAETINNAVAEFRKAVQNRGADVQAAAGRLHRLILSPIEGQVPKQAHVLISPAAQLSLVPFDVLWHGRGNRAITYLDASRDLLRFDKPPTSPRKMIGVSNPDYGKKPTLTACGFDPLPAGREEAEAVAAVFRSHGGSVRTYEGADAVKTVLASAKGTCVLHLATRSFFLEDLLGHALQTETGEPNLGGLGPRGRQERFSLVLLKDDPLCRSGLAFAGANRAAQAGLGPTDGIATSLELARLDLRDTELVVLSGCDTGLGDVNVGGSISALRRALGAAGARCIVMSLWQTDPKAKQLLLTRFYKSWLGGKSKADALHAAKEWLRTCEDPATHRTPYAHPYYWAPFILVGDWR